MPARAGGRLDIAVPEDLPTVRATRPKIHKAVLQPEFPQSTAEGRELGIEMGRQWEPLEIPLKRYAEPGYVVSASVRSGAVPATPLAENQVTVAHAKRHHGVRDVRAEVLLANRLELPHFALYFI